ncbi:NACHT domain-containing protein [Crossiella sp. SN42]|uniref:NACHT domain-containing protein n=1 Tax=Crossiella sp. SN42 TaxID=2944808 RepID=UPI00207C28B2|nr:NACHT domain-containing protein [Crossiella sp. SN42]MCO1578854.1 NACHT domain-containing protein [Crossiella sp. SN42]
MIDLGGSALKAANAVVLQAARTLLADHRDRAERHTDLAELVRGHWTDTLTRRKVLAQLDRMVTEVLERLLDRAREDFRALDEQELTAAAFAVGDTLAEADLSDDRLFAADADARKLAIAIRAKVPAPTGLSADAHTVYDRLLDLACLCLVRMITQLKPFPARASAETLARLTDLAGQLALILDRLPYTTLDAPAGADHDEDFRFRYLELISTRWDVLELFGLPLRHRARVKLSIAYLNLTATGATRLSATLAGHPRTFVRGEAGCGKTTLLRWLAVTAARNAFDGDLAAWNGCVPFLVKLRSFADAPRFPRPGELFTGADDPLFELQPPNWVHRTLDSGRALVLIDGVDELPAVRRKEVRAWLDSWLHAYPRAKFVITSRPAAVAENWLAAEDFHTVTVEPMARADIRAFIRQWHEAMATLAPPDLETELSACQAELLRKLDTQHHLAQLATSPLLCAMLCALNLDRESRLPQDRNGLYQAALEMFLEHRDDRRGIRMPLDKVLDYRGKVTLLRDLAWRLTLNEQSELDRGQVEATMARKLQLMPSFRANQLAPREVLDHLLVRSGLIREPVVGRIDFVHRTFQEYLAAGEIAEENHIPMLIKRAHEVAWREVVLMTPGQANLAQRAELIRGLLSRAKRSPDHATTLRMLAVAAGGGASTLPAELLERVRLATEKLLPPKDAKAAAELAVVGEVVLDHLPPGIASYPEETAVACVLAAAHVGGPRALALLREYAAHPSPEVQRVLVDCWRYYDPEDYARQVPFRPDGPVQVNAAQAAWAHLVPGLRELHIINENPVRLRFHGDLPELAQLTVRAPGLTGLPALHRIPNLTRLDLPISGRWNGLEALCALTSLRTLVLRGAIALGGLAVLRPLLPRLTRLELWDSGLAMDLSALAAAESLEQLVLLDDHGRHTLDLTPLTGLVRLRYVIIDGWADVRGVRQLERKGVYVEGLSKT